MTWHNILKRLTFGGQTEKEKNELLFQSDKLNELSLTTQVCRFPFLVFRLLSALIYCVSECARCWSNVLDFVLLSYHMKCGDILHWVICRHRWFFFCWRTDFIDFLYFVRLSKWSEESKSVSERSAFVFSFLFFFFLVLSVVLMHFIPD